MGFKYLRGKGKHSPSSDDVFYHLNKLAKKDVVWVVQPSESIIFFYKLRNKVFSGEVYPMVWIYIRYLGMVKQRINMFLVWRKLRGAGFGHGYASIECVENG
ncbi:MAG TPA: hypothetical protein ENG62_01345 [Thermoplasmatales archaeon]|nr:hypothetical protein [Thermoplasmatales archaeon]